MQKQKQRELLLVLSAVPDEIQNSGSLSLMRLEEQQGGSREGGGRARRRVAEA
jgi:hypothetical protein